MRINGNDPTKYYYRQEQQSKYKEATLMIKKTYTIWVIRYIVLMSSKNNLQIPVIFFLLQNKADNWAPIRYYYIVIFILNLGHNHLTTKQPPFRLFSYSKSMLVKIQYILIIRHIFCKKLQNATFEILVVLLLIS